MTPITGILPALITPFEEDGRVDLVRLADYVETIVSRVDGLFVCGSYGSGPLMSVEQRSAVAETVAQTAKRRARLILHVGAPDEESVHRLTAEAADFGYDAVAAVSPYYYRHSDSDVEDFYKRLIDLDVAPVFAYNNPKYSNHAISPELLGRLAKGGLRGVKDSSGSISTFYDFISAVEDEGFTFLIGSQTLLLPALIMGGHGCVSGLSNAFPELISSVYRLGKDGRIEEAANQQRLANALRKLTGEGIPIPFYHAVLPMLGINIGSPRRPFRELPHDRVEHIRKQLTEYGMIGSA